VETPVIIEDVLHGGQRSPRRVNNGRFDFTALECLDNTRRFYAVSTEIDGYLSVNTPPLFYDGDDWRWFAGSAVFVGKKLFERTELVLCPAVNTFHGSDIGKQSENVVKSLAGTS
jgi:hypothetical protein